jgi:hypothetical protein
MAKNSGTKTGKVLGSYRKIGPRFVPPMLQMFQFDHISWLSQTMPELVWWDVLITMGSLRFAARVAETIAGHFKQTNNREHWWAFLSDYRDLPAESVLKLVERLVQANIFTDLQTCLSDFLNLYPACPIARVLDVRPSGLVDIAYLSHFEDRLRVLEHKRSKDGVFVQAQAVYMAFVSGRLHVREGLALADFPEVSRYPETERSLQVGASVCATVNGLAGEALPKFREDAWVQYFWKRSLELHPLAFGHLERE